MSIGQFRMLFIANGEKPTKMALSTVRFVPSNNVVVFFYGTFVPGGDLSKLSSLIQNRLLGFLVEFNFSRFQKPSNSRVKERKRVNNLIPMGSLHVSRTALHGRGLSCT